MIFNDRFSYYGLQQYAKAVEAYESALELDPENAPSLAALKQARQRVANQSSNNTDNKSENKNKAVSEAAPSNAGGMGGMPDLSALLNNPAMATL
jgi:small glutamine-rich tetratricopeptide repeat-containing protein alpha